MFCCRKRKYISQPRFGTAGYPDTRTNGLSTSILCANLSKERALRISRKNSKNGNTYIILHEIFDFKQLLNLMTKFL